MGKLLNLPVKWGRGCLYLPYCEDEIFSKIHVYYVLDTDKGLFVFLLVSLQHSYSLFNFAINIQGIEDALGLVLASRLQLPQFHPGLSTKANVRSTVTPQHVASTNSGHSCTPQGRLLSYTMITLPVNKKP